MEQPREPRFYRNEQQRFSISSETEKTLQSIDSTLKRIEKLIIQQPREIKFVQNLKPSSIKSPIPLSVDSVARQIQPKQNSNMQKQHSKVKNKEENLDYKQTHLNRYYAWKIIRTIATPPPAELQRIPSEEYAKISRKEIKGIFKYTISLLKEMFINSLDDVKF